MAFPYTTHETFEDGTKGHFDAVEDAGGALTFPHYTDLARFPKSTMPYRGAYCMRVELNIGNANSYVQETGSWALTAGTDDLRVRFKVFISKSLVMADGDSFALLSFRNVTDVVQAGVYIGYTQSTGEFDIGIGGTSGTSSKPLALGEWHDVEVFFDPAILSGGTIDGWFDGGAFGQVAGLTNTNITSGLAGVISQGVGTTQGTVYIDEIVGHKNGTSRIGSGGAQRFPQQVLMERSGHVFVGSGILSNVSLLAGGAVDNVLTLYDTDLADTVNGTVKLTLKNIAADETPIDPAGVPINISKGCYIELAGTNPRAMIGIHTASAYGSDGVTRMHGLRRQ